MQKTMLLLVALMIFLVQVKTANAQAFQWELLTASDAADVVRSFENNPNLQFNDDIGLADRTWMLDRPFLFERSMVWSLSTDQRKYHVSLYSRKVFSWSDAEFWDWNRKESFYGQPYDENVLSQQTLPVEQLETIAREYAAAHYATYSSLNQVQRSSMTTNDFTHVYIFHFYQKLPNGVKAPSTCGVSVETVKGQVVGYSESTFPILVSTTPTLTASQAAQSAIEELMSPFGGSMVEGYEPWLQVLRPDILGMERLVWNIEIQGWVWNPEVQGAFENAAFVMVDAHNGEVVDVDPILADGGSKARPRRLKHKPPKPPQRPPQVLINKRSTRLSYPPILKGNSVLLYVGYLRSQGVTVNVLSPRTLEASVGKRRVQLTVGRRRVKTHEGRPRLKTAPIEVKGRVYVPAELFSRLTGFQIQYDRLNNILHLTKPTAVPPLPERLSSISRRTLPRQSETAGG